MKKLDIIIIFVCILSGLFYLGCASTNMGVMKTADVNNDGNPDVTYYTDGKFVSKIEADTNYDGKTDVVVNLKDGKFQSAEADADHNGTMETRFNNLADFNKWVNRNDPAFSKKLNRPDWSVGSLEF